MNTIFNSVLVANRGEIACRIIRTARDLGYRTIAVYSEADAGAPHVQMADEAVLIGPAAAKDSYLDPQRILQAAQHTGAEAVHPGYGFLSENAEFADACKQAGLIFIGPSAAAIDAMGNKAESKRRMLDAGVPCIPGYQDKDQSDSSLLAAAREIGVPIMVKAAAGGGGRGMRLVDDLDALPEALASARSEAQNAFGSAELILEKALIKPRHVEVQVFGDSHGNLIHLGERDCSVQRRHQKVVEEAPCPVMTPELRAAMGQAAVKAARSIDYQGAGTVEFLLDADQQFYFLEMNTRLQVEHPVTELVTGLDLVQLQLDVAQGESLPLSQDQVTLNGHAIEVRLYAEDSEADFLPASGRAQLWQPPAGAGVRVDHGLLTGQEVSPFYDPMVAKIIASGPDRKVALRRLIRALENTVLMGFCSNREFLLQVLRNANFASGQATTAFIEEQFPQGFKRIPATREQAIIAACLQYRQMHASVQGRMLTLAPTLDGWSSSQAPAKQLRYTLGDDVVDCQISQVAPDKYTVLFDDQAASVEWLREYSTGLCRMAVNGRQRNVAYCFPQHNQVTVQLSGQETTLTNALAFSASDTACVGSGMVTAPMHGNLLTVMVSVGDQVSEGDGLAVMEAMKMEHKLQAQVTGTVIALHASAGDQVSAGATLLEIEQAE